MKSLSRIAATLLAATAILLPATAAAQSQRALDARSARVVQHWTPERRAAAIPRDFVIDERGLGYIRGRGGQLIPHGHDIAAQAGPPGGGSGDSPVVTSMSPGEDEVIGASATFSATVVDTNGVKSVSINVRKGTGPVQSFNATHSGGVWSVSLSGFTDGTDWSWYVVAKDKAKPSNTTTSDVVYFSVDTAGGGGGGGDGTNEEWTGGGVVQQAAGRIYFEMPSNKRRTRWVGYVCSGTVATDGTEGRSIIITAAHCVYDDANKAYAANVLFIPNQADSSAGTDTNCGNDPKGCWTPDFGVVDLNWTTSTFPANKGWDYAYYVVSDVGAHSGNGSHTALDAATAAGSMAVQFSLPTLGDVTHGLGYSYSDDPNFMYCVDPLGTEGAVNWWLPDCGLSGGSSGGPWVQPLADGNGPIISVNSWGYTTSPGMAGPKLAGTSASCVFNVAKDPVTAPLGRTYADGDAGVTVTSCP